MLSQKLLGFVEERNKCIIDQIIKKKEKKEKEGIMKNKYISHQQYCTQKWACRRLNEKQSKELLINFVDAVFSLLLQKQHYITGNNCLHE